MWHPAIGRFCFDPVLVLVSNVRGVSSHIPHGLTCHSSRSLSASLQASAEFSVERAICDLQQSLVNVERPAEIGRTCSVRIEGAKPKYYLPLLDRAVMFIAPLGVVDLIPPPTLPAAFPQPALPPTALPPDNLRPSRRLLLTAHLQGDPRV